MKLVSWPGAVRILGEALPTLPAQVVPLAAAQGRALAEAVSWNGPRPSNALCAMDGYAARARDAGRALRVDGVSTPAREERAPLELHTCRRVFTGAHLPAGADTVVPQEDVVHEGDTLVRLPSTLMRGRHVVHAGAHAKRGAQAKQGRLVRAPTLAGLLEAGHRRVPVRRAPRVHIVPIGDEFGSGERPESNGQAIAGIVDAAGARATLEKPIPDDVQALGTLLNDPYDLHVSIGGTSVGMSDVARRLATAEADVLFEGVAVRPGRPVFAARLGEAIWLAIPGNPAAALLLGRALLAPQLRRMQGSRAELTTTSRPALLRWSLPGDAERTLLVPVTLSGFHADPAQVGDHGTATWLDASDGVVVVPPRGLKRGVKVQVLLW